MKKKELIAAKEASDRIIHRLNGRIYGLERSNKELVDVVLDVCKFQYKILVRDANDAIGLGQFSDLMWKEISAVEKVTGKTIEELLNEK